MGNSEQATSRSAQEANEEEYPFLTKDQRFILLSILAKNPDLVTGPKFLIAAQMEAIRRGETVEQVLAADLSEE